MPDTTYLNKSPNYLKWIKTLSKADLQEFSSLELESMIRELVGEELNRNPEKLKVLHFGKDCLIRQIGTYVETFSTRH